jgi:hypothetical protein
MVQAELWIKMWNINDTFQLEVDQEINQNYRSRKLWNNQLFKNSKNIDIKGTVT